MMGLAVQETYRRGPPTPSAGLTPVEGGWGGAVLACSTAQNSMAKQPRIEGVLLLHGIACLGVPCVHKQWLREACRKLCPLKPGAVTFLGHTVTEAQSCS